MELLTTKAILPFVSKILYAFSKKIKPGSIQSPALAFSQSSYNPATSKSLLLLGLNFLFSPNGGLVMQTENFFNLVPSFQLSQFPPLWFSGKK